MAVKRLWGMRRWTGQYEAVVSGTRAEGDLVSSVLRDGVTILTGREKETLRLLLSGHNAKSIARELGLSVHTINERLRDSRRKLNVSSSREAARLLAEVEQNDPDSFADKKLGVGSRAVDREDQRGVGARFAWLGVGVFMLAFSVAGVVLSASAGKRGAEAHASQRTTSAASTSTPVDQAALKWLGLHDRKQWAECWRESSVHVKSDISEAGFISSSQNNWERIGSTSSRKLVSVNAFAAPPGFPSGYYANVVFRTDFARKKGATETVALSREGSDWKVIGYHIL